MAMHSPTPTEHKLLLLCALDRLGPVTAQQLLRFMVETELMDYIALHLSLAELVDADLLHKLSHAIGTLYAPSAKGHDTLTMFLDRIPHSLAVQIDTEAETWRARFKQEKHLQADWTRIGPMAYTVRLRAQEDDDALLDLTVNVPTRDQAISFCERWPSRASAVYAQIMRLMGEVEEKNVD